MIKLRIINLSINYGFDIMGVYRFISQYLTYVRTTMIDLILIKPNYKYFINLLKSLHQLYNINKKHLDHLPPEECVEIFSALLHADALSLGLSPSDVSIADDIHVPDGGIDAIVVNNSSQTGQIIQEKHGYYQIKCGVSFEPHKLPQIKRELCKTGSTKLKDQIQQCVNDDGTYKLICMQRSFTPAQKKEATHNLVKYLCDYWPNPKIQIFDRQNILSCINKYPSLCLQINNHNNTKSLSFESWSQLDDLTEDFVQNKPQQQFIEQVHDAIYKSNHNLHLHIDGEPGVGKTRLILEAMRIPLLRSQVVYFETFTKYDDDNFEQLLHKDKNLDIILIIDECNDDEHSVVWTKLKNREGKLTLITLSNEISRELLDMTLIHAPKLDDKKIIEIIQNYYNDSIMAERFADLCGGIPRLAHIIGLDLKNNPDNILQLEPHLNNLFLRFIRFGEHKDSDIVRQREIIFCVLALFKKFSFGFNSQDEINVINEIIRDIDNDLTPLQISAQINKLRKRKILQGENTLYINLKALHIWAWKKWWNEYGSNHIFILNLLKKLPPFLLQNFFQMFVYMNKNDTAADLLKRLFSKDGPLYESNNLRNHLGSELFRFLALIDPKFALIHLERIMEKWTPHEFKTFYEGRRNVVCGLELIVHESDLFYQGGVLLRNLAEYENEDHSANATNVFCKAFTLKYGIMSKTKTLPLDRISLLEDTLCSNSNDVRKLGLHAFDYILESPFMSGFVPFMDEGLQLKRVGWEPKDLHELGNTYQYMIKFLFDISKKLPKEDHIECITKFLNNVKTLMKDFPNMANYLISRLTQSQKFVGDKLIIETIVELIEYNGDRVNSDIINKLKKLQNEIIGTDYNSLMNRYVKMKIVWDNFEEYENESNQQIKYLAKKSLDIKKLKTQLDWLVTDEAWNGALFGYELSRFDENHSLLLTILKAQKETNKKSELMFLSGYLRKIFEGNSSQWNKIMQRIAKDTDLMRFFVKLIRKTGTTKEIEVLLLKLIHNKEISILELENFANGAACTLTEQTIVHLIEETLKYNDQKTIFISLGLYYYYFIHGKTKKFKSNLAFRILIHDKLFDLNHKIHYNNMVWYYWKKIGLELIQHDHIKSLTLLDKLIKNMGMGNIIGDPHSQCNDVLDEFANKHPNEIWEKVSKYSKTPLGAREYVIWNWIRGGTISSVDSLLEKIDFKKIYDWIDENPDERARLISRFVPPYLTKNNITRNLLVRYGSDEKVKQYLIHNFSTGSFTGSLVTYYQIQKDKLEKHKKSEKNLNVKNWIDYYIEILNNDITSEKIQEERDFE